MDSADPEQKKLFNVEYERHRRLMMDDVRESRDSLLVHALETHFDPGTVPFKRVTTVWKYAQEITYKHGNIPSWVYLNHPLRVALILLEYVRSVNEETLCIALLHNILETSDITEKMVRENFGESVAEAIRALTIDRTMQSHDYLKQYYARIEGTSRGCAEVKVADKLDNIYMICFTPSESIRNAYLDEIEDWVIPLASRSVPELRERMAVACDVMRKVGYLDKEDEIEQLRRKKDEL